MKVTVFFDGGNRRKHGLAAGAAVVYDDKGNELAAEARFIGAKTSNEAEYTGLHIGLELAAALGATEVTVYGDSELVVRQVREEYNCLAIHLQPMLERAWELGRAFESVRIIETPPGKKGKRRDNNAIADALCGQAMDEGKTIKRRR